MPLRYLTLCLVLVALAGCDRGVDANGALTATRSAVPESLRGEGAAPEAAPDFTLPGLDGPFALGEQRGRVVLLTFWASWSEPSVAGLDTLAVLTAELAASDLVAVGVTQDEHGLDSLRAWADAGVAGARVALTLVSDSAHAVARSYGDVEMLPTTVVVDRAGRIRARHVGVLSTNELLDLVAPALIEGEAPPEALPAAVGAPGEVRTLAAEAVRPFVADGAALLDVRDAAARAAEGAVRHAAHRPLDALASSDLPANLNTPVIFLADTEAAARAAAEKAAGWGYAAVYAVGGGARAWRAAGLTLEPASPAPAARPRGVIG